MISLSEYLYVDKKLHKFDLPFGFFAYIRYLFMLRFLEYLPITNVLFISGFNINRYYWQIIANYLHKELGVNLTKQDTLFQGRFLQSTANVFFDENHQNYKRIRGHGNSVESGDEAISKAIGEFLERYFTSTVDMQQFTQIKTMTWSEIQDKIITTRDFHSFNDLQIQNNLSFNIKQDDIFQVIPVLDLIKNKKVYYPLRQIFWKQEKGKIAGVKEKVISNLTTSGCAGGFSLDDAKLSALYELIERDAFMCYWLTKNPPDILSIESGGIPEYDNLKNLLNQTDYEIFLLNITTELAIPCCLCLVINKKTNGIVISAGADLSMKKAILKAMGEMRSCMLLFERENVFKLGENYIPFVSYGIGRTERLALGTSGKYLEEYKFLISGNKDKAMIFADEKKFTDKENEFKELLEIFKNRKNGFENIYLFEVKNKLLDALGYYVVRVIVPKLYPLYLIENQAMTESVRLQEFNLWKKGVKEFELNSFPHPFP